MSGTRRRVNHALVRALVEQAERDMIDLRLVMERPTVRETLVVQRLENTIAALMQATESNEEAG